MEISYKLENFEGPLDLLLHLIEKNKVSIYDIPIVTITEQYLAYVNQMEKEDLDLVSDFLVMAATLIDIKSRMLLPVEKTDDEEEAEDPRTDLVKRLLEYKMYQYIAGELEEREEAARQLFKEPTIPAEVEKYEPPVDLDQLLDGLTLAKLHRIFEAVMKRSEDKVDRIRSGFKTIKKEPVSLEQRIRFVSLYTRKHKTCRFRELLTEQAGKMEIVVTFLAVLELMKIGKISLLQENLFDDIYIEATDTIETADTIKAADTAENDNADGTEPDRTGRENG